jgi:hypothetical protein
MFCNTKVASKDLIVCCNTKVTSKDLRLCYNTKVTPRDLRLCCNTKVNLGDLRVCCNTSLPPRTSDCATSSLSPHTVSEHLHASSAAPQLPDNVSVTDDHQCARDAEQHHELVDREFSTLLRLIAVVQGDTGYIVTVHNGERLLSTTNTMLECCILNVLVACLVHYGNVCDLTSDTFVNNN